MPKKVFISYRRDDTASAAGRVFDRLSRRLGKSNVFFDVSTIGGGADFTKEVASQISRSDVALVFIGDKWLGQTQPTGRERIWDPADYVRAEVRAALARPLVLPVLVAGACMPKPQQMPEDIQGLTSRNALLLRHERFDDDVENIVATVLGESAKPRAWEDKSTLGAKVAYGIGGAIAASALMLLVGFIHFWMLARPLSASIGRPLTVLMLAASLIFGVWLGLSYEARKRRLQ